MIHDDAPGHRVGLEVAAAGLANHAGAKTAAIEVKVAPNFVVLPQNLLYHLGCVKVPSEDRPTRPRA
jgi:hypothetical protein